MGKNFCLLVTSSLIAILAPGFLVADDQNPGTKTDKDAHAADRAAIRKTMRSFAEAFQKGDPGAAAAYLTPGAELIPYQGSPVRGREAIRKAMADHFTKNSRPRIKLEVESVHFPSRDSALEEGEIKVSTEKEANSTNRYSVLYVREDGKWLLAMIREWPSERAALQDLDWLIGSWAAKTPEAEVQTAYEWFGNKSFIQAQFTVRQKDKTFIGKQLIGADPKTGELRTWTF